MRPEDFNFDKFAYFQEEMRGRLLRFMSGEIQGPMVVQRAPSEHWGAMSHNREDSLSAQLDCLNFAMQLHSDLAFNYLEPWHGVGVYAAAFGCPVLWYKHDAPQTKPRYSSIDELSDLRYPDIGKCELMQKVLDTIRYLREQTGDSIPIALTDTQSPNDTASLILDTSEFFASSIAEPEMLEPLMDMVTRLIIEFSELQIEAIGRANLASPGHIMPSDVSLRGISVSDDNMAVISPASYQNTSLPYNSRLSEHFGGIAIHTCGNYKHTLPLMMETPGLAMVDCALRGADPNPNKAEDLLPWFAGKDIVLKVRVGLDALEEVYPLLTGGVKLIVDLCCTGSIDERNRQYEMAKEQILRHCK